MAPKLIAITGPLKATVVPMDRDEMTLGRELENVLLLDDVSISRHHCVIRRVGEGYALTDLDSHNGTFVNDIPIKERFLEHGDRIRVGNTVLMYLAEGAEEPPLRDVQLSDEPLVTEAEVKLRLEDALYSMARDLGTLMKACSTLTTARRLADLERELLEQLFAIAPAQRAAILLTRDGSVDFDHVAGQSRAGEGGAVSVSRTIVQQTLQNKVSLLSGDVVGGDAFSTSESLLASGIKSLICVPLVLFGEALGVIYLDTSEPDARFDQGHLRLVTAIANVAAGVVASARHTEWLESENRRLRADSDIEHNMIGESRRMHDVCRFIARVSPTDSTVLISGESGTGKELAARAIHRNSPRASGPFVAVNCAALTETLLESEFFGHEKGAFTGAVAQRKGRLEIANGGTLFLDEVGELSLAMQAKLLRVLQEREFERVGGTRTVRVDLRVLTATNRDLEQAVGRGEFRRDLFYRLNVISLTMPPLRERREDIPLLSNYFASKYSQKCKRLIAGFTTETRARLTSYDWPGNVRELENAVERAVVLGSTALIQLEDLPEAIIEAGAPAGAASTEYHDAVIAAKRKIISDALARRGGNYTEAAKELGVHPNNLHRLVRDLKLRGGDAEAEVPKFARH